MSFSLSKKPSNYLWINEKIIPWHDGCIHVATHSLHYAGAVFEGERAYDGKIFKLAEHTTRLLNSAKMMHLEIDYSINDIIKASEDLLKINNLKNAYIRPLIWRGSDDSLSVYNKALKTNLLILAQASNPVFRNNYKLTISPWKKASGDVLPIQSKSSAHYAMSSISQKLAQEQGYDDCLILDRFDCIAECSTTNIFFAKDKLIVTPIADRFLNGITRQVVIKLAQEMGIEVSEKRIRVKDITQYNACFATGTSAEIRGISTINTGMVNVEFSNYSLVKRIYSAYKQLVGKNNYGLEYI